MEVEDLHDFQLCVAHGLGKQEAYNIDQTPKYGTEASHNFALSELIRSWGNAAPIPNPTLFNHLTTPPASQSVTSPPTVSQCAAHLQLLEAIHNLNNEVIKTDRLNVSLGIKPGRKKVWCRQYVGARYRVGGAYKHVEVMKKDLTFPERSKRKWTLFLNLAAVRFKLWAPKIEALMRSNSSPPSQTVLPHLPPIGRSPLFMHYPFPHFTFNNTDSCSLYLDILIVWHAFLLNPGDYRDYCKLHKLEHLRSVHFPWLRIVRPPHIPFPHLS